MKIALFTETYLSFVNGVGTHVKTLKNGLEKLGHEVLVVCALPGIKKHCIKDGVLCCPSMSWKKIYDYGVAKPISPTRFKFIKNFAPDIIHIHTEFGIGFSGASAAKLLRIPYVYTMHTMYDEYIYYVVPKKLTKIAKKIAHFYGRQLAQRASVVVGPSVKIEDFLRNCGVEKPIEIVPNSVEVDLFNPEKVSSIEKKKIREELSLKETDFLGCFCARLGKEKNVDLLIKNWKELVKENNNKKLLIFGDGPYKKEFEDLAESLNIKDNVIFLGKVEHKKLPPYYSICDFYITASLSEVHSISTLEAMASKLPVFHILDERNQNQIKEGVNGFIYKDVSEMKELILKYENMSEQERQNLKNSTRNSVLNSGELQLGENMIKIYDMALDNYSLKKKKIRI